MPTVDFSLQVRRPPTSVGAVSWGQEQVGGWLSGRKRVRPTDGWMNARRSLAIGGYSQPDSGPSWLGCGQGWACGVEWEWVWSVGMGGEVAEVDVMVG
jgi:hypothetical protein